MKASDQNIQDKDVLEIRCKCCSGDGGWWPIETVHPEWNECIACGGSGFQPTPFGQKVLDLVRRHVKAILLDAQKDE